MIYYCIALVVSIFDNIESVKICEICVVFKSV